MGRPGFPGLDGTPVSRILNIYILSEWLIFHVSEIHLIRVTKEQKVPEVLQVWMVAREIKYGEVTNVTYETQS